MRPALWLLLMVWVAAACGAQAPPPRFSHAGVIEGFYGTPWSHADRLDLLRFMGRVGLNTYVYAPKDDPYHRERWREPYPRAAARQLEQLVDTARASRVAFWYAISPGASITYGDSADYRALWRKIGALRAMGVTTFGLFFDDVPTTLTHEADRRAFGSLAAAQASLVNRLHRDLQALGDTLVVTPTTYTAAWGDRDYLRALGRSVNPAVPFFWTGTDVASPTVSAVDAARWTALAARPPLLWDNFPVNDYAPWRLFLGPLTGRATDLARHAPAIIANPMNQAHASMIPLATLAAYAADPGRYDPAQAHHAVLTRLYGDAAARRLQPVVEAYGGYGWDTNVFQPLYILEDTIPAGDLADRLDVLEAALQSLRGVATSGGTEPLAPLVRELAPVVAATRARLDTLRRDTTYRVEGRRLVYRRELDRYEAPAGAPVVVDGHLDEWAGATWYALRSEVGVTGMADAAFRSAGGALQLAVRVRDATRRPGAANRLGAGDHVQVIIDTDPDDARLGLTPSDLVVLVGAPDASGATDAFVGALGLRGFMRKWLADNRNLTLSEFLLSTFAGPHPGAAQVRRAGQRTSDGYVIELALPAGRRSEVRLSLSVRDTGPGGGIHALATRNYPANPETFVTVVLP